MAKGSCSKVHTHSCAAFAKEKEIKKEEDLTLVLAAVVSVLCVFIYLSALGLALSWLL